MARDAKKPDLGSEKYQVSDPSVLFEDVWAADDDDSCAQRTRKCPTCGYDADLAEIRCPRCFTLLVTGCSGSCATCGQGTCTAEARKR
jgi:hypothetical protein